MAYFLGYIISGVVFGAITKYVAESKGYEGGFWWGFFLGVIGLLVVGFRPDNNQQGANSPSNSSAARNNASSQTADGKEWNCIKCSTSNPQKSKFCCECGEPRHYEWKCGSCGEINAAKVKFCFNCGKQKEAAEEIVPEVEIDFFDDHENESDALPYIVIDDELIQCKKCGVKQAKIYKRCFRCGQSFETFEEEM